MDALNFVESREQNFSEKAEELAALIVDGLKDSTETDNVEHIGDRTVMVHFRGFDFAIEVQSA